MDVRAPEVAGGRPRKHCVLEDCLDGLEEAWHVCASLQEEGLK